MTRFARLLLLRRLLPQQAPRLARCFYVSPPEPYAAAADEKDPLLARKVLRRRRQRAFESFEEYPNILASDSKQFRLLRAEERPVVDFASGQGYAYGIDAGVIREWLDIARSTMLHGRLFSRTSRRSSAPAIAPVLLLAYSGEHGEVLLANTAMGMARALNADFLSMDFAHLGRVGAQLTNVYAPAAAAAAAAATAAADDIIGSDTKMSDIIRDMPGERQGLGYDVRPIGAVLRYLEHCMASLEGAAARRVIYIHGAWGSLFRQELVGMLAERPLNCADTLFVLSEGSNYSPGLARTGTRTAYDLASEEMEHVAGLASTTTTTTTNNNNRSLTVATPKQHNHAHHAHHPHETARPSEMSFAWMLDEALRAPRILLVPPADSRAAAAHRRQIQADLEWLNYEANFAAIQTTLLGLSSADKSLVLLLGELGRPEELFARLPYLHRRVLSPAEATALCLSLPCDGDAGQLDAFVRAVADFATNRQPQIKAFPYLTSGSHAGNAHADPEARSQHAGLGELNKYEKRLLGSIVYPSMVRTRYEDIGALEGVKRTLHELISLRLERPDYFTKGILRDTVSGILLFGPPGTGKTMLARAVAAQSGASFLSIQSSSIFDMYVGEGEKNVRAVFTLARKLAPCVIFLDEVDALLDHRSHSVGRASRVEIINEFMAEWDGLLQQNQGITVMAATNRPFALDDAVLRRLPRRVLVDLPDARARADILRLLLRDNELSPLVSLPRVAERCEHYSGSDLKSMCMAAATRVLRRLREGVDGGAGAGTGTAVSMELLPEDLEGAMDDVPPSLSDRMTTLAELREWNQLYGEGRVRKTKSSPFGFS